MVPDRPNGNTGVTARCLLQYLSKKSKCKGGSNVLKSNDAGMARRDGGHGDGARRERKDRL